MKRNNYDLKACIIRLCQTPQKKTWIVYGSNTNFKLMDGYLQELVDGGLVRCDGVFFSSTDLGVAWLERFDAFVNLP